MLRETTQRKVEGNVYIQEEERERGVKEGPQLARAHAQFRLKCIHILITSTPKSTQLTENRRGSVSVTKGRGMVTHVKFRTRAMRVGG